MMAAIPDERIGDSILRIVSQAGVYRGTIIRKGKLSEILEDDDLSRLRARLRNEAGKMHPDYFGIEGAIARFLQFFPAGFSDSLYLEDERSYKIRSREKLISSLPLAQALEADAKTAVLARSAFATNLLSQFELARANQLLKSPHGAAYVRGAARFANGHISEGLGLMKAAIEPYGRASWPLVTYLPNLWLPEQHMFLKPNATRDYAERIGHDFSWMYAADLVESVYESLMDLVATTENALVSLSPRDRIDVQSFIWVVGDYSEKELTI